MEGSQRCVYVCVCVFVCAHVCTRAHKHTASPETLLQPPSASHGLAPESPCSSIPWPPTLQLPSVLFPFGAPCSWVGFGLCAKCLFSGRHLDYPEDLLRGSLHLRPGAGLVSVLMTVPLRGTGLWVLQRRGHAAQLASTGHTRPSACVLRW